MVNKIDIANENSTKSNNQKNFANRPYVIRNRAHAAQSSNTNPQHRILFVNQRRHTLLKEQELEIELERLFKSNPDVLELKELPQHKIPCYGLDMECRRKFEIFYKKLNDKSNAFNELFRKDLRI